MKRPVVARIKHNTHIAAIITATPSGFLLEAPIAGILGKLTALVTILIPFGLLTFYVMRHTHGVCTGCPEHTQQRLRSLPFRLFALIGRVGVPFCGVFVSIMIGVKLFGPSRPKRPDDAPMDLGVAVTISALFTVLAIVAVSAAFTWIYPEVYGRKSGVFARTASRFINYCGHHMSHIVTASVVAMTLVITLTDSEGRWGAVRTLISLAILVSIVGEMSHGSRLCEPCGQKLRLDAPEYAERPLSKKKFTFVHVYSRRMLPVLVVLALINPLLPKGFELLVPCFYALIGMLAWVYRFHGKYQVWCPYCHGRGRGDDEEVPEPTPTPGNGRPVPV